MNFDELLAECIERSEDDESFDLEAVLRSHPEHADELRRFFINQAWMGSRQPPPPADLTGRTLGNFELIEVIGRGGMGIVYRARQTSPARDVALKVISGGSLAGEEERTRFHNEATATASLDHPGIVPIIEAGQQDGLDYFAMRLVEGPTLCEKIAQGPLPPNHAATLIRDASRAVDAAHRAGVIHRDIKPDNIMIDTGGRPVVLDFGLARVVDDPSVTRSGQVLGTPHYMSPQQASGVVAIDARTDVYSLGAVLYALLSGRPPHGQWPSDRPTGEVGAERHDSAAGDANAKEDGPPLAEVLRRVLQDDPPPLTSVARHVPSPLARICHTALQYNPDARYQSAAELADDLHRFVAGEPVYASETGVVRRVFDEIDRDAHRGHFMAWSRVLWQLGLVIAAAHLLIYLLQRSDQPLTVGYWLPRGVMLSLIAARIAWARDWDPWPRTAAERPVWSIWLGYITALGTINVFAALGWIETGLLFPLASLLSAFGYIAMAGQVWGGSGLLGLGFLIVAVLCHLTPSVAPLWFGAAWLVSLLFLSRHYRRH